MLHCAQFPALLPSFSSVFGSNLLNDAELMHIDPVLERFRKGEGCRTWRLRVSERRGIEPGLIKILLRFCINFSDALTTLSSILDQNRLISFYEIFSKIILTLSP